MYYSPLFGFEVTKKIELENAVIHPVFSEPGELRDHITSKYDAPCTAIIETEDWDRHLLFWLETACTVADRRASKISDPVLASSIEEALSKVREDRWEYDRPNGPGKLIIGDNFSPASRREFLRLALNAVYDTNSETQTEFSQLLHKLALCYVGGAAEFVEVKYYLLFSGLEALARKAENYVGNNTAEPMTSFIVSHGFDFAQQRDKDLFRGALTYTSLRNACFHNGELAAPYKPTDQRLRLSKYARPFEMLVGLLVLKHIGFDDSRTNWNSWLDRMPFKTA